MKLQKICSLAVTTLLSGLLMGQTNSFGVYGGISIPNLKASGDNEFTKDYESRQAATFGIFGDFGITKSFSIKAIISYAGQGGKRSGMQPVPAAAIPPQFPVPPGVTLYGSFENESVLNYLEIPVLAKLEGGSKLRYYINAGPYVGFMLNATQKVNGSTAFFLDKNGTQPISPVQTFNEEAEIKDELNTVNFGLTGGGGIKYMFNANHALLLDARGAFGLTTLQKDVTFGESKTGALFLTLGYSYSIGGK